MEDAGVEGLYRWCCEEINFGTSSLTSPGETDLYGGLYELAKRSHNAASLLYLEVVRCGEQTFGNKEELRQPTTQSFTLNWEQQSHLTRFYK